MLKCQKYVTFKGEHAYSNQGISIESMMERGFGGGLDIGLRVEELSRGKTRACDAGAQPGQRPRGRAPWGTVRNWPSYMEGLERAESDSGKEVSTFNLKGRAESWALVCKPDEGFRQASTRDQSNVLERL